MIRIGVTGHRVLTEIEKIDVGIEIALDAIVAAFGGQSYAIISQIAEGADRMVAKAALARSNVELFVVMPMTPKLYEADFRTKGSKAEFRHLLSLATTVIKMPEQKTRQMAYQEAGKYVLNHCDVLLAVWDGKAAHGQGGTGELVSLAKKQRVPIAWVHAGNRKARTLDATTLGAEQGHVSFANFQTIS